MDFISLPETDKIIFFINTKYGCPCRPSEYGGRCRVTGSGCYYEDCPFIFWIKAVENVQ